MGGGETGLVENLFGGLRDCSAVERYDGSVSSRSSTRNGGDSITRSDLWEGVGVERRMEGGDLRACYDQINIPANHAAREEVSTNDSKPWGACMTEFGCSSSSELGLKL